jgi:hypothetical protein
VAGLALGAEGPSRGPRGRGTGPAKKKEDRTRAIPATRSDHPSFQPIAIMYNIVYIVGAIVIIVVILKVLGLF